MFIKSEQSKRSSYKQSYNIGRLDAIKLALRPVSTTSLRCLTYSKFGNFIMIPSWSFFFKCYCYIFVYHMLLKQFRWIICSKIIDLILKSLKIYRGNFCTWNSTFPQCCDNSAFIFNFCQYWGYIEKFFIVLICLNIEET